MSDDSERPGPAGMVMRRLDTDDHDQVRAVLELRAYAFQYSHTGDEDVEAAAQRHAGEQRVDLVLDEGRAVATFLAFDTDLAVPGGALVCAHGVSGVAVAPTHKRRGLLRSWLAPQLRDARDAGVAVSVLTASDARIYGRFGYGIATAEASSTLDATRARFVAPPVGTTRVIGREEAYDAFTGIERAVRVAHPGTVAMSDQRWRAVAQLVPGRSQEDRRRWFAEHRDSSGELDGAVGYSLSNSWKAGRGDSTVEIHHLAATTPEAERELWRHCAGIDFATRVVWRVQVPEPRLPWWVDDPRSVDSGVVTDALWVRILDVIPALEARAYEAPGQVVLRVADDLAGGTFALEVDESGATCHRVESDDVDVEVDIAGLASLWLGGGSGIPGVPALRDVDRLRARDDATASRVAALFRTATPPHLLMHF